MSHHIDNPNAVQRAFAERQKALSMPKSGFKAQNADQFIGYEAGQHDGAIAAFETIADWIEEDCESGCEIDGERYIETLRRRAKDPFVSKVKQ